MGILAVIDTNVLVSALYKRSITTPTVKLIDAVHTNTITPVLCDSIVAEYDGVLRRPKFNFDKRMVDDIINEFNYKGMIVKPYAYSGKLIDEKDRVFLEAVMAARHIDSRALLVTGNKRHFPAEPFILSPAELLAVIGEQCISAY